MRLSFEVCLAKLCGFHFLCGLCSL